MSTVNDDIEVMVTRDLMMKVADDITSAVTRTLALTDDRGNLPIAVSAGAACLGVIAAILDQQYGDKRGGKPDPDCVLLAALLAARTGIGGEDPVADAYRDLELLKTQAGAS